MSKITMLETDYATLWYYPEDQIVHHQIHRYIHGDHLRDVLNKGLDIFAENKVQKWLSDDRNNSALPQADIDWAMENWVSVMKENGWKYWAIVLPDKAVGKVSMERLIESYRAEGIEVDIFESPDEAYQWLQSK